jgi:hypothetical protein
MLAGEQALDTPADRQLERAQQRIGHRARAGAVRGGLADDAQRQALRAGGRPPDRDAHR